MNLFLIFIIFFFAYKIETVKIRPNFNEIFGNGWNKNEEVNLEEKKQPKTEQNENSKQITEQIVGENDDPNDQQKRETIQKFEAIKEKLREKGKYQRKNNTKIERKIGKLLGANRQKIYEWKKELNLNKNKMKKSFYDQKKKEFIERFNEFKSLYGQGKQKEFVKELGISQVTFRIWKKELMPKYLKSSNKYTNEDKLKKIKQYFEIKEINPKISDEKIAKKLEIGITTLKILKKNSASIWEK